MADLAIKTEGICKDFRVGFWRRRVRVLSDLDMSVRQGEVFGFLGPNGAGKTTTLKILCGLLYPSAGRAWVLDREVGEVAVRGSVGFLPENPSFYEYLTGRELLDFYGHLLGLPRARREDRIAALAALVGLAGSPDLQVRRYSKGMVQRLGLAQALLNDPRLVILDEPMSGLDPVGRKEVRDIILQLKGEGRTVFFSSHIIPDVEMICDRVGILVRGRLVSVGRLEELLGHEIRSVEVTASGLRPEALERLAAMALRPSLVGGDQVLFRLAGYPEVEQILKVLSEEKAQLVSVIPLRLTLEELFLQEVGGGPRA